MTGADNLHKLVEAKLKVADRRCADELGGEEGGVGAQLCEQDSF